MLDHQSESIYTINMEKGDRYNFLLLFIRKLYLSPFSILFLVILLYYPARAFSAYAGPQSPTPTPTPVTEDLTIINLNSQDWEKLFKAEEVTLRKIKEEHVRKERKRHIRDTEHAYQKAVSLYRQRRVSMAKEALGNVEDLMADYKSTDTLLRGIYKQAFEKLRRKMRRIKLMEDPQLVINLAQQASGLYNQVASLWDDKDTAVVRNKLGKLRQVMEKLKREKVAAFKQAAKQLCIQQQLDRIGQKSDNFDREIFRLTQSKDYPAAKKKFGEFQRAMIDDLAKLKQAMARGDNWE